MTSTLEALYSDQGHVVVLGLTPDEDHADLVSACTRAISKTRLGTWPHGCTVGKQFPPYGTDNPNSWGVQHSVHPDLGEWAFVRWYTSQRLAEVVKELLGCREDIQMEVFNILINSKRRGFALRWHRDDMGGKTSEEDEREALGKWRFGWNTYVGLGAPLGYGL